MRKVCVEMIITRITAGMGNQMFMYAAGLSLSHRLNTELKLHLHGVSANSFRKYSLNVFPNITEARASLREVYKFAPFIAAAEYFRVRGNSIFKHPFRRLLYEFMSRTGLLETGRAERRPRVPGVALAPIPFSRVYFPPDASYPEEFTSIQDNTYITGFWESEKFFKDIAALVRRKFTFPAECFDEGLKARVKSCSSVALHVRLGDKAANNEDKSYVSRIIRFTKSALAKIEELTDEPKFFVFSDDVKWCRENLPGIYDAEYTFIDGQTPAQDMALMTQCRHVITSASTFSWWGAWLNENPSKIVITPDVNLWYPNAKDRGDLLPPDWLKIG